VKEIRRAREATATATRGVAARAPFSFSKAAVLPQLIAELEPV
jgi:hypothetical protein